MDDTSQKLIEDCFLRPIMDTHATNKSNVVVPAPEKMKTELQVLHISEDSRNLTMQTLRGIHGDDFRLDDASKYKDRGGHVKKSYWQDRGNLIVQSVTSFSSPQKSGKPVDESVDRMRRFALVKLENYGFPLSHCIDAYDGCEGDTDAALLLLFRKYMRVPETTDISNELYSSDISEKELLEIRADEKAALDSIYDTTFTEKEKNLVWSLQLKIDHLLAHSPSTVRKALEIQNAHATATVKKKPLPTKNVCRNFEKDGLCKFGNNCRFAHIKPEVKENNSKDSKEKIEDDMWFYLEVRFPPNSKYPYEAPFTFVKTTCHDIARDILLRISRRLYREACELAADGMPCVYSVSEILQKDESLSQFIKDDNESFPNPNKPLDCVESDDDIKINPLSSEPLPTHYKRGETSRGNGFIRDVEELQRENKILMRKFIGRQKEQRYRKVISERQKLPAFAKMTDILEIINKSQVVVISGETGCGKSTQVPQFILDNWFFEASKTNTSNKINHVEIICTQPRRLSAIAVAERVAYEQIDRVGQLVGYQIRLENKISNHTRLTFCTTGILLRRLSSDPLLQNVTHIIVDEVHERSEESDFLLMILKRVLKTRTDLKVILMSATLNAKLFSEYFGGAPTLDIPGRTFPVEQFFLENILDVCGYVLEMDSQYCRPIRKKDEILEELEYSDIQAANYLPPPKLKDEDLKLSAVYARYIDSSKSTCKTIYLSEPMKINPELIESVLKYIVEGEHEWPKEGSILIFLPGLQEIQNVHEALVESSRFGPRSEKYVLVPLHSSLSSEEQSAVFHPAPTGKRKIVLSTNIAETSITIDDCTFVIDCGLMKEKCFDSNRNMESLDLVWVSRANAMQRKGRAGRVMPGICIHLYTKHRFNYNILSQPIPEIHRVPLEQLLLRIKTLPNFDGENLIEIMGQTMEPPKEDNTISAVIRLQDVGALDNDQELTPLGHHLSALPVDVRIGKLMLYGAIFQCLDSVLTIAACLSHKSPFVSPFNKRSEAKQAKKKFTVHNSDHLTCLLAYKKWVEVSKRSFLAARNYADENFLSLKTLQTISEVKYQFLELLVSIGFVPINVPRKRKHEDDKILQLTGVDLNINGENNRLLISLLCAALYPNIAKVLSRERSYVQTAGGAVPKLDTAKDLRFKTKNDGYVAVHPSSVNADIGNFQSPFLVYQEKLKTSRIFIRECSMLPIISLVLFAGSNLKIELHGGDFLFLLEDGWIILKAHNLEIAEMISCLRIELFKLLEEKIRDPCLNLLNHENGCKIINNIVYLIANN